MKVPRFNIEFTGRDGKRTSWVAEGNEALTGHKLAVLLQRMNYPKRKPVVRVII